MAEFYVILRDEEYYKEMDGKESKAIGLDRVIAVNAFELTRQKSPISYWGITFERVEPNKVKVITPFG
ncbi:MAG: hypothetical protein D6800_03095 [Candidatus Zixiibacteriota bacterium]|nr:MAG: hypothetical protein D6800_03095 [candidate division Zixibacteria bacterium]